jgi:hypothetical protein
MATATQVKISPDSERALITYAGSAHNQLLNQFSLRTQLETIDRYYQREDDFTEEQVRARVANRMGDKKKFQDVTVPIVMPQVQAALGYMTNVFLTGYPIFGVAGDPATEDAALQMETIIAENSRTAGWARQLLMFFRDGLKYNLHAIECDWTQKTSATIETDLSFPNNAKPKNVLWKGNTLKRMDLYNTFFDIRVHPAEIHSEGEYAGYIEMMSRIRMKKFFNELYGTVSPVTAIRALESTVGGFANSGGISPFSYYTPSINPYPLMSGSNLKTFDWMQWAGNLPGTKSGLRYSNVYEVMKLYARILPADFGLRVPEENTPQVWKFIIVNGQVVAYAERLTNAHGFIPIFFGQPLEDGLDLQTKSFATNVADMQDVASAMWNGYIASKRRLVGDRVLYDPLRVSQKDINSTNPAAKIPVRPSAYGKTVADAVYQFPFHDEQTKSLLEGSDMVVKFANLINQQNPAQQGQFVKGNKTRHEYEDIMGHGNSTNQMMAIMSEAQVFTPMKECIKLNILQYQPEDVIYNTDKKQPVTVKPEELRKAAIHFTISDGLLPEDKLMSVDEFGTAMQALGSSPGLAAGYRMTDLLTYIFKMRGADLRPFEKSQAMQLFEQQLNAWQGTARLLAENSTFGEITPDAMQTILGPMPKPPPELQQEVSGQTGTPPSPEGKALEATQS